LAGIWRQWAPLPSDASFDVSFSREDRVEDEFDTALDGEILPKCRLIPLDTRIHPEELHH